MRPICWLGATIYNKHTLSLNESWKHEALVNLSQSPVFHTAWSITSSGTVVNTTSRLHTHRRNERARCLENWDHNLGAEHEALSCDLDGQSLWYDLPTGTQRRCLSKRIKKSHLVRARFCLLLNGRWLFNQLSLIFGSSLHTKGWSLFIQFQEICYDMISACDQQVCSTILLESNYGTESCCHRMPVKSWKSGAIWSKRLLKDDCWSLLGATTIGPVKTGLRQKGGSTNTFAPFPMCPKCQISDTEKNWFLVIGSQLLIWCKFGHLCHWSVNWGTSHVKLSRADLRQNYFSPCGVQTCKSCQNYQALQLGQFGLFWQVLLSNQPNTRIWRTSVHESWNVWMIREKE